MWGVYGLNFDSSIESFVEFQARVGEILGRPFQVDLEAYGDIEHANDLPPMFPADATDDQMEQIAALLAWPVCFVVQEVEFSRQPANRLSWWETDSVSGDA